MVMQSNTGISLPRSAHVPVSSEGIDKVEHITMFRAKMSLRWDPAKQGCQVLHWLADQRDRHASYCQATWDALYFGVLGPI
jgi:hypothetical protein